MKAMHFHGQTHVLEAPPSHDHRADGEIIGLPVQELVDERGRRWGWRSAWKPSPEQLAMLNAGGCVFADWAGGQPPCNLDVGPAEVLTDVPA